MFPQDFDEYIRQGEPDKKQRAENWQIAIGLQAVDQLKPSAYLIQTAQRHVEGEITIDEAQQLIDEYYQSKEGRIESENNEGAEECDKVAGEISKILEDKAFVFSVASYSNIHRRLFSKVLKHAGEFRTYNITKREWVLDGDTVTYARYEMLKETLNFDFSAEKDFDYSSLSKEEQVLHLAKFISGIWQIHAFAEGNTRTTAIFLIQYLKSQGFVVDSTPFKENSWYFRNALVRANYTNREKNISSTTGYLERFFRNILFGATYDLKNRYLHINAQKDQDPNWNIQFIYPDVPQNVPQNKRQQKLIDLIKNNNTISREQLSEHLNVTIKTIQRDLRTCGIEWTGPSKTGHWEFKFLPITANNGVF